MNAARRTMAPVLACLMALTLGGLLLVGLAGCGPKQVEVPDLNYLFSAEAESALNDAGLKLGEVTEKELDDIKLGDVVVEQSAAAGTKADEGSAVDIVVTKGPKMGDPVTVPDLTGMTAEEAEKALSDLLLIPQPGNPVTSDTVEPGKVCAQSEAPGAEAAVLDTVTYSVSRGKEKVAVPNVTGKTLTEARAALEEAGFGVDTTTAYDDKVAKDSIISQSVKANEQVDKGTVITLNVSLGVKPPDQVAMPNLISFNLAAAKATLDSAGLKYSFAGDEDGTVVSQNPAPGTKIDQGSSVTFELKAAKATEQSSSGKSSAEQSDSGKSSAEKSDSGKSSAEGAAKSSSSSSGSSSDEKALAALDAEQIVFENGLGEYSRSEAFQFSDGKWYLEIESLDVNNKPHYYYADAKGKLYVIDDNNKMKPFK